jgi:predicted nucleic acid-binding protein
MRVVVDTNVLISAAIKDKSIPAMALHRISRRGLLLKSDTTELKLIDVLARPYLARVIAPESRAWIARFIAAAEAVKITERSGTK